MSHKKRYYLFNPETGLHTQFETLAQVKAAREAVLKQKIDELRSRYGILEETVYENGDAQTRPYQDVADNQSREVGFPAAHKVRDLPGSHPLSKRVEKI